MIGCYEWAERSRAQRGCSAACLGDSATVVVVELTFSALCAFFAAIVKEMWSCFTAMWDHLGSDKWLYVDLNRFCVKSKLIDLHLENGCVQWYVQFVKANVFYILDYMLFSLSIFTLSLQHVFKCVNVHS